MLLEIPSWALVVLLIPTTSAALPVEPCCHHSLSPLPQREKDHM